jgi:trk system potassium uptake protein TrkA
VKVVIAGGGNVGTYLARDLTSAGHDVLVIEIDPAVAERGAGIGFKWMVRDACEVSALDLAGLSTTDVVVAATGDDEDNLVVSLLAKQEFAVPRVIARVNHPKNHWLFNKTWGVDVAVSTPHLLAALVEEAVSVGSLVRLMQLESSGAHLVEVTLAPGSPVAGIELARVGMPREATVVAVVRRAHVVVPRGDTVLEVGDEVLVLTAPESEEEVRALLVSPDGHPGPRPAMPFADAPAGGAAGWAGAPLSSSPGDGAAPGGGQGA